MNVQELKEHILKHMSAEEALTKLLEGHLIEYQKLKFSEEGKEIHPAMLIVMATMEMGWNFVVKNDDGDLNGMIVGTDEYLDEILSNEVKSEN